MRIKSLFFTGIVALLAACGALEDVREIVESDVQPPQLLEARTISAGEIELIFDEQAFLEQEELKIAPPLELHALEENGERILLTVSPQTPGAVYTLEAGVRDGGGNRLSFLATLYGFNPEVPRLLINEFNPRGSETHPDLVELVVAAPGNMGGVAFYQGTPGDWSERLIFPPFLVREGEFILIHCRPQGIPEEIDETSDIGESGGLEASGTAFDFWISGGRGLGGNNGVLCLSARPGGPLLDGLLYSNRTSASDERYGGFGSLALLKQARELAAAGGWNASESGIRPEDGINPESSTATRSICRDSFSTDTDSRQDWHVVPTRGATFGRTNSDEVY